MKAKADKSAEHKGHKTAAGESTLQHSIGARFQFADNRPAAVAQRKLQNGINASPRVLQQQRLITSLYGQTGHLHASVDTVGACHNSVVQCGKGIWSRIAGGVRGFATRAQRNSGGYPNITRGRTQGKVPNYGVDDISPSELGESLETQGWVRGETEEGNVLYKKDGGTYVFYASKSGPPTAHFKNKATKRETKIRFPESEKD